MLDILKNIFTPAHITSFIIVVGVVALLVVLRLLYKKYQKQKSSKNTALSRVIYDIIRSVLVLVAVLVVLEINGINVTSLITGLGIASVIVGLALQDPLRDIIMGIHIMTDRFFEVGDTIDYLGSEGEIVSFNLKTTKLRLLDDKSILVICNRDITKIKLLNKYLNLDIPLPYDEDYIKVRRVMKEISEGAKKLPDVLNCEFHGTQEFSSSAILYRLRVFCDPVKKNDVRRTVLGFIQEKLAEEGINIPFNQLDVHHYNQIDSK